MTVICTKIEAMKIFVEYGLTRLKWDLRELNDETLNWRITQEANSVKWLLTHISMILNVYFPRAITNNLKYLPENWIPEYHDNEKLTLEIILMDIEMRARSPYKILLCLKMKIEVIQH